MSKNGVLVAVSIPIFTSQLRKARVATDLANERAGKAAAVAASLSADDSIGTGTYYYDAANGVVKTSKDGISTVIPFIRSAISTASSPKKVQKKSPDSSVRKKSTSEEMLSFL